jgi:hypothetical protein
MKCENLGIRLYQSWCVLMNLTLEQHIPSHVSALARAHRDSLCEVGWGLGTPY